MLKFFTSILFARASYNFLKFTKLSTGTSIIGRYVLKICPNFLSICNNYIQTQINVTGTNGKTTTSGLISHLIQQDNHSIVNNSMGANMLNGVVNALAISLKTSKKTDFSVIESDEAYLSKIYEQLNANYLVVTNLFRDQLDRYGELATTKRLIQEGINKKENLTLFLNADDPLVSSFDGKNKIFYGIENIIYANGKPEQNLKIEESFNCICGKTLNYSKKFFAQQGHYYCDCGYKRPEVKYKADIIIHKDFSILRINNKEYKVPLVGLFNAYNALAAIAVCEELGIKNIQKNLETFKVAFGRSEVKYLKDKKVLIQLIKNPIGANEVLKTIDKDSKLLIIINDNYADGRDVSWLWDAEFELLQNLQKEIIVSGIRANDMALRLKYANVNRIKVIKDINKAIDYLKTIEDNNITILPTYTALLNINKNKNLKTKRGK